MKLRVSAKDMQILRDASNSLHHLISDIEKSDERELTASVDGVLQFVLALDKVAVVMIRWREEGKLALIQTARVLVCRCAVYDGDDSDLCEPCVEERTHSDHCIHEMRPPT